MVSKVFEPLKFYCILLHEDRSNQFLIRVFMSKDFIVFLFCYLLATTENHYLCTETLLLMKCPKVACNNWLRHRKLSHITSIQQLDAEIARKQQSLRYVKQQSLTRCVKDSLTLKALTRKLVEFANSTDPDEAALNLHGLASSV